MRGDAGWFDDVVRQWELAGEFESAMSAMGLDVRDDVGYAAWFHFNQSGPLARQHRYDCLPVWQHKTFAAYGGYEAYVAETEDDLTVLCTVCCRDVPAVEWYSTHISMHPCE